MRSALPELKLTAQAADRLHAAARESRRRERGGILVGYRSTAGLVVEDALPVVDELASHQRYVRRSAHAGEVLTRYLQNQHDGMIGYIGEWHTHPLPVPPSTTDHASMAMIALRNTDCVALLVAALQRDLRSVSYYALASEPSRHALRRRVLYRKARVTL